MLNGEILRLNQEMAHERQRYEVLKSENERCKGTIENYMRVNKHWTNNVINQREEILQMKETVRNKEQAL